MFFRTSLMAVVTCMLSVSTVFGANFIEGEIVTLDESTVGSQFVAGESVTVSAPQLGDLFTIGESVVINETVAGDVRGAGESVTINSPIDDDVRVAGSTVDIRAAINGELFAAGNVVTVNAPVALPAWIGGSVVTINDAIVAGSRIDAESVSINTSLSGPLTINANSLVLGKDVTIEGTVMTNNTQTQSILEAAGVSVSYEKSLMSEHRQREDDDTHRGMHFHRYGLITLLIFAGLFLRAMPNYTKRAAQILAKRPWQSLGLGALILIATPIVVIVLLITLIGAPLAGLALAMWILMLVFLKVFILVFGIQLIRDHFPIASSSTLYQTLSVLIGAVLLTVLPGVIVFILGCFAVGTGCQQDWKILKEIA